MKKHLLFLFFCIPITLLSCQGGELSKSEKKRDFLYLYNELEANYPLFELAKRRGGDWLAKKDEHLKRLQATRSDTAYIRTLEIILEQLGDSHTDLYPTIGYDSYLNAYNALIKEEPGEDLWLEVLKKDSIRVVYWSKILSNVYHSRYPGQPTVSTGIQSRYSDTIIADKRIAIMNIPSFINEVIPQDSLRIDRFLSSLRDEKALIINIQGNSGGSTRYWEKFIVPRLITDTISYPLYFAMKKGDSTRKYFSDYFENPGYEISKQDTFYNKIPESYLDSSFLVVKHVWDIVPVNPIDFKGTIYVLVDEAVYSASEAFTVFAKRTGWAIIAGQNTGGDGIGRPPILLSLPSGIKLRFTSTAGFNPDGKLNAEKGSDPDWFIMGKSKSERLDGLIYAITQDP